MQQRGATILNEARESARQLYDVVRVMRGITSVPGGDDSEDFTAGYVQALDDLLAWLKEDFAQ